ncbi:helix-turn-helix transcriptional regulator [Paenibacillus sp. FSL R10-2796]|uniref:helix-turn-helix domain-containing protein n=1 Tax=Paenibacillus sp. FSL R10-2796 TaxID=2954663 RepID=UPI0030DCDBBB
MKDFGEKLKALREEKLISQRFLAELASLDHTYISKIESGESDPPAEESIIRIAKALNTDKYSLIMSAGRIPKDYQIAILSDTGIQAMLRDRVKEYPHS